ncbi:hypothetical protein AB5I41_27885 [Sphingomonas sp. MMS24-JH45]
MREKQGPRRRRAAAFWRAAPRPCRRWPRHASLPVHPPPRSPRPRRWVGTAGTASPPPLPSCRRSSRRSMHGARTAPRRLRHLHRRHPMVRTRGFEGYQYNARPVPAMDAYGRLLPAPNRFPSSIGGRGFRPLADRVHALGLRFGVHLMRGVPRRAVERDLPVLGTRTTARAIADPTSVCSWNPDMYGVDMRRDGAQAYYDGVFALLAGWGVDFVKVDDLSRPYDAHAPEIEAIRRAMDRSGRRMMLSMSPGETPVVRGARAHAQDVAHLRRFLDEWPMLEAQFIRLEEPEPVHGRAGGRGGGVARCRHAAARSAGAR